MTNIKNLLSMVSVIYPELLGPATPMALATTKPRCGCNPASATVPPTTYAFVQAVARQVSLS